MEVIKCPLSISTYRPNPYIVTLGRSAGTRTRSLTNPNRVPYQLGHTPTVFVLIICAKSVNKICGG